MIEILINDDRSMSLKTTNGIDETEIASSIVIEAMRNLYEKKLANAEFSLVLVGYTIKLQAVKEIKEKLNLKLKEAKDIVDECTPDNAPILLSGTKPEICMFRDKFDYSIVKIKVVDNKNGCEII